MAQAPHPYDASEEGLQGYKQVATALSEQVRLRNLGLEISVAIPAKETLYEMLTACTEALVRNLNVTIARIWTFNEEEQVLELQASSGMYTHLNSSYARVPVGESRIGLIAAERTPQLTNTVIDDPGFSDQEWARHEGIVAFAGYPLLIEKRLIGVVAMFARQPFTDSTLQTLAIVANSIALGIERTQMQEEHKRLLLREQEARREAEIAQRRLELAQQVGRIGTFEWDIRRNHVLRTPRLAALYGLAPDDFGNSHEDWVKRVHPDDLPQAEASLQGAIAGGPPYNAEFRIIWPDGTIRWMLAKGEIISRDKQGHSLKMIGVNIDITERKEAELEMTRMNQRLEDLNANLETEVDQRTTVLQQLNTELQRSNQELQDFAYVASHDLQEPLRKIQAFGNLLEEEYGAALGEGRGYLDRMRSAAARMRVLIHDLLAFSRVTTKAQGFSPVDLNVIADEVVDDLEAHIRATQGTIEIGTLPTIEADTLQIRQVFQNLLGNALKFHRPDTPPTVKVYAEVQHNPAAPPAQPEQCCVLFFEDNGIGFDEKYLDRIFTVFQRLHGKSEYEGTGIGLAIVRKIVERHGGTITACSTIGQGTTFIVTLPMPSSEKEIETIC